MSNTFYIQLLGHIFHIYPLNNEVLGLFKDYLVEPKEDAITIVVTPEKIEQQREISENPRLSDIWLERTSIHQDVTDILVKENIFLFHGSALMKDGYCFLFTGKSGAGKSTHSRMWRELFGDEVTMINDDKPYLKIENNQIMVYGTPWNGKHGLGADIHAPLKSIGLIHQSLENKCIPVSKKEAFISIFTQTYRPDNPEDLGRTLQFINTLLELVPVYDIYCTKSCDAARVSHDVMNA